LGTTCHIEEDWETLLAVRTRRGVKVRHAVVLAHRVGLLPETDPVDA
jgi:hypothetical protein